MMLQELTRAKTRTAFTLADQGLSSFSNFALGIVVARNLPVVEYGVFAAAYSVYGIGSGVSRALATDPLVVRFSGESVAAQRRESERAVGSAAVIGVVMGLLLLVASRFVGSNSGVFVAMACGLPILMLQDSYRYVFFTTRRSHQAAIIDAVWVGTFLALLAACSPLRDALTAAPLVLAWAACALVSLMLAAVMSRILPDPRHAVAWLRGHADLGPRFAGEFLLSSGGPHFVIYLTAVVAGYAASGAVRGGNVLMGPVWIAAAGLAAAAIPEGVRLKELSRDRFARLVYLLAVGLGVLSILWGVVAANLPPTIGHALLGETWTEAQPLMFTLGVFGAGYVASVGVLCGLRSLAAARRSFAVIAPTGVLVVLGGLLGAIAGGALGACVGMVVPVWIGTGLVVWQFRRALADAGAPA